MMMQPRPSRISNPRQPQRCLRRALRIRFDPGPLLHGRCGRQVQTPQRLRRETDPLVISFCTSRTASSEPCESADPGSKHVRAMTCGEAVMKLLWAYEVDTVFGMAGTMTLELYRGIAVAGIRHVQCRNEQGASLMADGYAR